MSKIISEEARIVVWQMKERMSILREEYGRLRQPWKNGTWIIEVGDVYPRYNERRENP